MAVIHSHNPRNRARRRQAQRGAAVFIVVMVLALLTAVGIFAVRSASMADAAAGYDREGAQAALVAQYGITATAAFLGKPSANLFIQQLAATGNMPASGTVPFCESNGLPPGPAADPPRASCLRIFMDTLNSNFVTAGGSSLFAPTNTASTDPNSTSSLNPNETTNALFLVELTQGAVMPGAAPGGGTPSMITVTAVSQVRPAAACAAGLPVSTGGQQVMRAMISAGNGK